MAAMGDSQRARRIPDAEWEVWRQELIRLYVEENASRREIIQIMANEHGFVITDTQLKHRFQKWDVKKYINDDDMTTMLALKRKRQALGKDIRFQYKGHDVEQERLERAYKRQKRQAASPTFIQPYIKVYTSPNQSPQPASQAFLRGYSPSQGLERQFNSHFNSQNMQASFLMGWAHDGPDPSQNCYTRNTRGPGFVEVAQTSQDELMTDATLVPVDSYFGQEAVEGSVNPSGYEHLFTEVTGGLDPNHAPDDIDISQPSPNGNTLSSGTWDLINWSPSSAPSVLPIDERSSDRLSVPRDTIPSPTTDVMPILGDVENKGGSLSTEYYIQLRNDQPITCANFDLSKALLPLQLMKMHLEEDFFSDTDLAIFSRDFSHAKLLDTVQSEWLRAELDNVFCWGLERFSKGIRKLQARRQIGTINPYIEESLDLSDHRRQGGDRFEAADEVQILRTAFARSKSHQGQLTVTLGTLLGRETHTNALEVLKLSFIPKSYRRTIGLCVTFLNVIKEKRFQRISPRLRTFSVIPSDSDIFKCIERNDIHRMQTLFDKREASPTDVAPTGTSLLEEAIRFEKCEMVQLLLEAGADTQIINWCGTPENIFIFIWDSIKDAYYDLDDPNAPSSIIENIDNCVTMTDTALRHGCEIENSMARGYWLLNPLFTVVDEINLELPPRGMMDALRYLCNIGCDIHQRNSEGLTLLLFQARLLCPSVISVLKFLIEKGADLYAVDIHNRGALHYALEPPSCWNSWESSCTDDCDHEYLEHKHDASWLFFTGSENYRDDYCGDGLTPAPFAIDDMQSDYCDEDVINSRDDWEALKLPEGYMFCRDWHGHATMIRKPLLVLKTRLRFKLLTLLRAGCDPNLLNNKGNSPSDNASYHGLWPEWTWALLNAGYIFDEDSDRWVKRVEDEVSSIS